MFDQTPGLELCSGAGSEMWTGPGLKPGTRAKVWIRDGYRNWGKMKDQRQQLDLEQDLRQN